MADTMKTLKSYVSGRLRALEQLPEHPQKAALANLRRGVGAAPGEMPELWGFFLEELPPEMESRDGAPTRGEWAVYLALTLYALHQQGHALPEDDMDRQNAGLGQAVRRLLPPKADPAGSSVQKRFNVLATAAQPREIAQHLRGMIQLLRAAGIPLDYARLAEDLFYLQFPDHAPGVRLRWGQEFYTMPDGNNQTEEETTHA